ncbi:MAG: hypothetical protein CL484_06825 [Acidobacteria bacterium]|nr:hypothetical protein [Acidobacteriota bacterium]
MTTLPNDKVVPGPANRHTAIGVGLNLLLLALISYGYQQSDNWKWAWILVGAPITIVTIRYAWHLIRSRG